MVPEVYLVGVGLGNPDTMTGEARDAVARSELLIGAARMVEPFAAGEARVVTLVRAGDISDELARSDARVASVLFSGDVGFYSGATAVAERLRGMRGMRVRGIPGVSTVAYLCARLLMPWQDAFLASAHGRECDPVGAVRAHAKTFLLTGGATKAHDVCAALADAGLGNVRVHVGERLSYDDERIEAGTASELAGRVFGDLAAMLVENDAVAPAIPGRLVAS